MSLWQQMREIKKNEESANLLGQIRRAIRNESQGTQQTVPPLFTKKEMNVLDEMIGTQQEENKMTQHFGSEFGLSKDKVFEIIRIYDYKTTRSIKYLISEHFPNTSERTVIKVIDKYLDFIQPTGKNEFCLIREKYRDGNNYFCEKYRCALEALLFPNDIQLPVSSARFGHFSSLVGDDYSRNDIKRLMRLSDDEFNELLDRHEKKMIELRGAPTVSELKDWHYPMYVCLKSIGKTNGQIINIMNISTDIMQNLKYHS